MRKSKILLSVFVVATVCIFLLTGPVLGKVKLSFAYHWTGTDAKAPIWESRIEEFQAQNPDIELELEVRGGANYRPGIMTQFAAGSPPDVFVFWSTVGGVVPYIDQGLILDLTDIIEADSELKDRFIEDALASNKHDGRIYGLPIEAYFCFLLVNEAMFEEYGAPLPTTYENLNKAIEVFEGQGVQPFLCLAVGGESKVIWNQVYYKWAPPSLLDEMLTLKTSFNNPYVIEATRITQNLFTHLPEGLIAEDYGYPVLQYAAGKTPMVFTASWMTGLVGEEVAKTSKVMRFPAIPGGKGNPKSIQGGFAMGLYATEQVAKDDAKKDAAIKLMKFMTDPIVFKGLAETAGMPCGTKNVPIDPEKVSPIYVSMMDLVTQSDIDPLITAVFDSVSRQTMWDLMAGLLVGDVTAEEFAEGVAESLKENMSW